MTRRSYGTIEGLLARGAAASQFVVRDASTGAAVECRVAGDLTPSDLTPALGRRVGVRGEITSSAEGTRLSVEARELRVFPDDDQLPAADDVLGILEAYE